MCLQCYVVGCPVYAFYVPLHALSKYPLFYLGQTCVQKERIIQTNGVTSMGGYQAY